MSRRWQAAAALIAACAAAGQTGGDDYRASIEAWRKDYVARLHRDDGWLTLVGLSWLKPGRNAFGSDANNAIVLPEGTPPQLGALVFDGNNAVRLEPAAGSKLLLNGKAVEAPVELRAAETDWPDRLQTGTVTFYVIRRNRRLGVRVRDTRSKYRSEFRGAEWFPIDKQYRFEADWVPSPAKLRVPDIMGDVSAQESPGYAVFRIGGQRVRLRPVSEGDQLFWIFRDRTSPAQSYPAGRFLYSGLPQNRKVILDFNKAYNPPCAYTPYATCPLPPAGNRLAVPIPAGQKKYHY